MHELSIALQLIEIAEASARQADAQHVDTVHLRLGVLAGVVKDSLLFAYDTAAEGTLLEGSRLEIEDVPLVIHCPTCQQDRELPSIQSFQCPICGTFSSDVRQGTELELVSLEIMQDEAETH